MLAWDLGILLLHGVDHGYLTCCAGRIAALIVQEQSIMFEPMSSRRQLWQPVVERSNLRLCRYKGQVQAREWQMRVEYSPPQIKPQDIQTITFRHDLSSYRGRRPYFSDSWEPLSTSRSRPLPPFGLNNSIQLRPILSS